QMDIVIAGHVDHGKSSVIGRLLAETGSLPDGKIEQIRLQCQQNSRPFEYAFLLDALKNEQAQGITIDAARCFFNTDRRHYIIHDAPGHIEFLKNMVTGAARAEAALLVIDADEGIQENSKRHGYILSMLGISQIAVLVNKMDLVDYSESVFEAIEDEYRRFLGHLGVTPTAFIPISAREGDNITAASARTPWYTGHTVLEQVDSFEKDSGHLDQPFRLPVQDIYKFTAEGDDRRIIAGTIETGSIRVGDAVRFYPSGKRATVESIEEFNAPPHSHAYAGQALGLTVVPQVYIRPGELVVREDQPAPHSGRVVRSNVFWMGHAPLTKDRSYKLKVGSSHVTAELVEIHHVLDASEIDSRFAKEQIERHDVAEVTLKLSRDVAYDLNSDIDLTSRFVIVDEQEIAGCGVILEGENSAQNDGEFQTFTIAIGAGEGIDADLVLDETTSPQEATKKIVRALQNSGLLLDASKTLSPPGEGI
ncbi:MAG: adenylyl-sulfate kinase, partial [Phycisphaerales bacterium]|nr:adenylyl-sulfate kinase [Phycisphaerales bacterium]